MNTEESFDVTTGAPVVDAIPQTKKGALASVAERWHDLSYITRMSCAFAAVAAMTALVAVLVLSMAWNRYFNSYSQENMQVLARTTASNIAVTYENYGGWSISTLRPAISAAQSNAGIAVVVVDVTGVVRYDSTAMVEQDGELTTAGMVRVRVDSNAAHAPILVEDTPVGTVYCWLLESESLRRDVDEQYRSRSYQAMFVAAFFAILLASIIGYYFARKLVRPINRMTETAKQIEAGDLSARTGLSGSDEVSHLGETFDTMAASVQQSLINERRLTTDVAHELRSPLQAIQVNVEAMIDGVYPADDAHLIIVNEEVTRLGRMVADLLELNRLENGTMLMRDDVVDVGQTVQDLMAKYDLLFEDYGLKSVVEVAPNVKVKGDAGKLSQAVTNLISNAIRYTPQGGTITVKVNAGNLMANISVRDTGIGLTPEEARQVFDRFWRADNSRTRDTGGLGIGLSLVKEIVQRHRGWVQVEGRKGEGACFTIHIPLYHEPVQVTEAAATTKSTKSKAKTKKKTTPKE